uniref:Uncharacterized protein n=1 Tax=Setaria viridis TaxID=4556 RepID=A0A4U6UZL0_SETVI|nr:hypothetical protein SEVIR_4G211701v2 [Setaria viridis]
MPRQGNQESYHHGEEDQAFPGLPPLVLHCCCCCGGNRILIRRRRHRRPRSIPREAALHLDRRRRRLLLQGRHLLRCRPRHRHRPCGARPGGDAAVLHLQPHRARVAPAPGQRPLRRRPAAPIPRPHPPLPRRQRLHLPPRGLPPRDSRAAEP